MTEGRNEVVFGVGRINPPTRGHGFLVKRIKEIAKARGARAILYVVDGEKSGKDKVRNPLTGDQRLELARRIFPGINVDVVSSPFEALEVLDLQGLRPCVWVTGSDRAAGYRRLLSSEHLDCEVVELNREHGDADGVSATAARQAARSGDMSEFAHHMSPQLTAQELTDIAAMICEVTDGRHDKE